MSRKPMEVVIGDKTFVNRYAGVSYLDRVLGGYVDKEIMNEEHSPMLFAMLEKLQNKKGEPIHYIRYNSGRFVKIRAVWKDGTTTTMSYRNMILRWNRWEAYLKCSESKSAKKRNTMGRPTHTRKTGQTRKVYSLNGFSVLGA